MSKAAAAAAELQSSGASSSSSVGLAALDDFIVDCFSSINVGGSTNRRTASRPPPSIPEALVRAVCLQAREVLMSQSPLLELHAPIKIVGDIHGQYSDLLRIFQTCGTPPASNYLFLGDYVDRGRHSVETMVLLLALKTRFPENFFILRGNHECASLNRMYGFFDECKRKYSIKIWKLFTDTFNCLPIAAIIEEKIFCCHGGLSPELAHMDQIRKIVRPCDVADTGLICDLLWSDPDDGEVGWSENEPRGVSFVFGPDVCEKFLRKHDLDLVCRGHQICETGFQFMCKRRCVTVFSAPNYCSEFDNSAAVMCVDENLMCSFSVLKPVHRA